MQYILELLSISSNIVHYSMIFELIKYFECIYFSALALAFVHSANIKIHALNELLNEFFLMNARALYGRNWVKTKNCQTFVEKISNKQYKKVAFFATSNTTTTEFFHKFVLIAELNFAMSTAVDWSLNLSLRSDNPLPSKYFFNPLQFINDVANIKNANIESTKAPEKPSALYHLAFHIEIF